MALKAEALVSQALGQWILLSLGRDNDFAREGLPGCDVDHLLATLAGNDAFPDKDFSIAMVGYGLSDHELADHAKRAGLDQLRGVSTDLHVATQWRNERVAHPRVIALARGYNPSVHGLSFFARASSSRLATYLLDWAKEQAAFRTTPQHRALVEALLSRKGLEPLRSLDAIARFLAAWSAAPSGDINAPRDALPALGLLSDPRLFEEDDLGKQLVRNLQLRELVTILSPGELRQRQARAKRYKSDQRREAVEKALERLQLFRTGNADGALSVQDAELVVRPPADLTETPAPAPAAEEVEEEAGGEDDGDLVVTKQPDVVEEAIDALLEGRDEDLSAIGAALETAWDELGQNRERLIGTAETSHGAIPIDLPVDMKFIDWVEQFCAADLFGGYFETHVTDLEQALHRAADFDPVFIDTDAIWTHNGQSWSFEQLLEGWDKILHADATAGLVTIWRAFLEIRKELAQRENLRPLAIHPREWLDTHPALAATCQTYLEAARDLYTGLQQHYAKVRSRSPEWAHATLDALLSLDLVQIKVVAEDRSSAKAVMLPLHPLHLWRYRRLGEELRNFAKERPLTAEDRAVLIDDLKKPEQFIAVIRAGMTPERRGLDRLLPVANDVRGLATFENLHNAVSNADGVVTLVDSLDRYILLYPNHARPLRLALINPPEPARLLERIVKLLDERRFVEIGLRVQVEIFATAHHRDRLTAASTLEGRAQDLIYEKIANGRLDLRVASTPGANLHALIADRLGGRSFHLAALFDESTISIRSRQVEGLLPMSPFCVRNTVSVDDMLGKVSLTPHPGEPPFSSFVEMINELRQEQRESTLYASADAASLRNVVDALVIGESPIAHWVLLADRALPEEAGMRAVRLLSRSEDKRQILLCAADHGRLATLMGMAFETCNLTVGPTALGKVLRLGANLIGSGLLDMIKKQSGQPDVAKVIGFIGMLLVARDLRAADPECLVAAVDSRIARLWLRLGPRQTAERCDLLAIRRRPGGGFQITAIEVKTTRDAHLEDEDERITRAAAQVASTAQVIESALGGEDAFAAPRLEMMKEVLVRAVAARWGDPAQDTQDRLRWGAWLQEIFNEENARPSLEVGGEVVVVKLRSADAPRTRKLDGYGSDITLRTITEARAEELLALDDEGGISAPPSRPTPPTPPSQGGPPDSPSADPPPSPGPVDERASAQPSVGEQPSVPVQTKRIEPATVEPAEAELTAATIESWPPPLNALGMIGQTEAVKELTDLAKMTSEWGRRYPDKLLVGPAGVGKSTIARGIGEQLLAIEPILFNGADLRKPEMIVERLVDLKLAPSRRSGTVTVEPCLIFIDEVHAITTTVATALLSALDDRRTTTVGNAIYSFENVVFLLATTDPGRLSEAFLSRPTRTTLRSYTLNEMAGIVWLHGRRDFDGAELSRDVCVEIAARMQCSPRPSVKILEPLFAHFFTVARTGSDGPLAPRDVAEHIDAAAVARWFVETRGIDANGLGPIHRDFLAILKKRRTASEDELKRALGISNRPDFVEIAEYLTRLGLVQTGAGGRSLTPDGRRYVDSDGAMDLRDRISRRLS